MKINNAVLGWFLIALTLTVINYFLFVHWFSDDNSEAINTINSIISIFDLFFLVCFVLALWGGNIEFSFTIPIPSLKSIKQKSNRKTQIDDIKNQMHKATNNSELDFLLRKL